MSKKQTKTPSFCLLYICFIIFLQVCVFPGVCIVFQCFPIERRNRYLLHRVPKILILMILSIAEISSIIFPEDTLSSVLIWLGGC